MPLRSAAGSWAEFDDLPIAFQLSMDLDQQRPASLAPPSDGAAVPLPHSFTQISGTIVDFTRNRASYSYFVDNPRDSIQAHHLQGRLYEEEELAIIGKFTNGCKRFLDIGANVGNHTAYFVKELQAEEVICIEPVPLANKILSLNIRLNDIGRCANLSYLGIALGDQVGKLMFRIPPRNLGGARAVDGTESDVEAQWEHVEVPMMPLDSLHMKRPIDFIKLDVEGMEIQALNGMGRLIDASRPGIFAEIDDNNLDQFLAWMRSKSYRVAARFRRYSVNENYMILPE